MNIKEQVKELYKQKYKDYIYTKNPEMDAIIEQILNNRYSKFVDINNPNLSLIMDAIESPDFEFTDPFTKKVCRCYNNKDSHYISKFQDRFKGLGEFKTYNEFIYYIIDLCEFMKKNEKYSKDSFQNFAFCEIETHSKKYATFFAVYYNYINNSTNIEELVNVLLYLKHSLNVIDK